MTEYQERRLVLMEARTDALLIATKLLVEVLRTNGISVEVSPDLGEIIEETRADSVEDAKESFERQGLGDPKGLVDLYEFGFNSTLNTALSGLLDETVLNDAEVVLYVDFTVNGETGEVSHRIFRDRSRVTELGEGAR